VMELLQLGIYYSFFLPLVRFVINFTFHVV
jgi:hypothetical protein